MSEIMLYKPGTMITCGPHSLDYVLVDAEDEEKIDDYLGKGYAKHPAEVVYPEVETEVEKRPGKAAKDVENKG